MDGWRIRESACSSPAAADADADADAEARRHSAALFRQIADVLITRLFTPRLCMTARLSRPDGRPNDPARRAGGIIIAAGGAAEETLKSSAQFTTPLWDTTYRKIRMG